ncbi:hypothetical protein BYT27DRAFT_7257442 [Phlegmacium glaucopus]|nr:hypothetical protein BYT27DRAFT_7257442 [Phlegmacium glaucopus]
MSAVSTGICAICARETSLKDLTVYRLNAIPNHHHIRPQDVHPKHDLYDGMLLHPPGVIHGQLAHICVDCAKSLKSDKIPSFMLANKLWIGQIPDELRFLTLPERILIAKYFPVAYIVKLYPKKAGACFWDNHQMYSGLKGNVSTYRLDQTQITSMIDGPIMPPAIKILAATIGITFVGPKNLSEKCMLNMFRVRRMRVRTALEWLKENNLLYSNIMISASRLASLPEDGIPIELMATAKHSTDVNMLYEEHNGYVPTQEVGDGEQDNAMNCSIQEQAMDIDEDLELNVEPAVLPLAHLGIVDVDGVDVTELELMAHALANCRKGGFEIERPVNVPYEVHVCWALCYEDKRFRKDPHFPFQVFGVCQKRQNLLLTITPDNLTKASQEETRGVPFSNPAVQMLCGQVSVIKSKPTQSVADNQSIRHTRSDCPSFYGAEIDLDAFCKTAGPDGVDRALNIASDPYASAKFFHFMIETILEALFGLSKCRNGIIMMKEGILGLVKSYVGTVEAQG